MNEENQREPSFFLKHVIRVLLIYRWTWISITTLLVLGVTVAVFTMTPRYIAECMVMIEPGKLNITEFKEVYDPTMSQTGMGDARREFTETQYHMLLSDPVLEKVFFRFEFGEHEKFKHSKEPLKDFARYFNVNPIRRTRLARVTFEWEDPELAACALSFLVKTYIEEYRRRRLGITEGGLEALKDKAAELRPQVEKKAGAYQEFMAQHNMVSLEENQNIIKERLKEISANLTAVEADRIRLESRYENIKEAVEGKRPLLDMPEVIENEIIRDLKLEVVKVAQEISNFSDRFGRNHPEMQRMVAKQSVIQGRLDREIQSILAGAEAGVDRIRKQEEELKRTLVSQEQRVIEQNQLAVQYKFLKEAYESTNESYRTIIKRIEEIEIASAAGSKEDNVFEITSPRVPQFISYPKKKLSILLAGIIGLFLGIGLSFLLYTLDGSIKTMEDEEELGLAVLGHVPAADKNPSGESRPDLAGYDKPRGVFAESFRSIRTALSLARAGEPLRSILVTSPTPAEGKDLISINIAISHALSGKRVLLIDCDMRRPRQHKVFGVNINPGLSNLLAGQQAAGADECIRETLVPGLSLLPSGPIPPNPMELISSARMKEVMEEYVHAFDLVVVNSPPALVFSDAVMLSQFVQGTVMVVRSFSTRREEARRTLDLLHRADSNLLGIIMNLVDAPGSRGGYYGYGYNSYQYYSADVSSADVSSADVSSADVSSAGVSRKGDGPGGLTENRRKSRQRPRPRFRKSTPEPQEAVFES